MAIPRINTTLPVGTPTASTNPIVQFGLGGTQAFANLFQEGQGQRDRVLDVTDTAVNSQLGSQQQGQQLATDLIDRKTDVFNPVENRIVSDAMEFSGEAEGARLAADGSASVGKNYDAVRRQAQARLNQMGINPASGRTAAVLESLGTKEAVDRATVENQGRVAGRDAATARLTNAAQLGAPLVGQATSALSGASAAGNAAVQNIQAPSAVARQDANLVGTGLALGMQGLVNAENNRLQEKQVDNNYAIGLKTQNREDDKQDADEIGGIIEGIGEIWNLFK